jgi:hypothetical protein
MTDYKSMFEQALRTLAAIDEALGIGDDGCGDPDQTLTAIDDLKAAAQRGEALALTVMGDQTSHDHNVTALRIKSEEHKCCVEDLIELRASATARVPTCSSSTTSSLPLNCCGSSNRAALSLFTALNCRPSSGGMGSSDCRTSGGVDRLVWHMNHTQEKSA